MKITEAPSQNTLTVAKALLVVLLLLMVLALAV